MVPAERAFSPFNFPVSYYDVGSPVTQFSIWNVRKVAKERSRRERPSPSSSISTWVIHREYITRDSWLWSGPDHGLYRASPHSNAGAGWTLRYERVSVFTCGSLTGYKVHYSYGIICTNELVIRNSWENIEGLYARNRSLYNYYCGFFAYASLNLNWKRSHLNRVYYS